MILVTGAAGKTGTAVVRALVARGARVQALVHRPENAAAVKGLGTAEVVVGSFEDFGRRRQSAGDLSHRPRRYQPVLRCHT